MANRRISELTSLLTATGTDVFAIVDNSTNETKKISLSDLLGSPGPIGANVPDSGVFTTLELNSGATVNHISQNPTLGTSNTALATQGAIKAYVDVQLTNKQTVRRVSTDSTAVVYDIMLVDSTNGDVTIELVDDFNGTIIVKKTSPDLNQVIITTSSGAKIDGQNQITIVTQYQSYYVLVDSGGYFII